RGGEAEGAVVVHVDGCVKKPGLYTLSATAHRINDAIAAAGGVTSDADMTCVNVAELMQDGEKVTIPARGAPNTDDATDNARAVDDGAAPSAGSERARGGASSSRGRAGGKAAKGDTQNTHTSPRAGKISINKASAANLETIPGIGPSTAQHIVADRAQHGKFKRLEDLMRVKGIGKKKFEKIKPHIVL
ncbi:comEA protein, partial [Fannyhessea vaginae PB189-T1-4]